MYVRGQTHLVNFKRGPIDIAFVVRTKKYRPLLTRQKASTFVTVAVFVEGVLSPRLAIDVCARIDRIAKDVVLINSGIGWRNPAKRY